MAREEFFPVQDVLKELDYYLSNKPDLDFITFSGSGEPTLYSRLDIIIDHIKNNYPGYKVAVLTNGTLLSEENVREQLMRADLVIPSLDAASEHVFKKINRPHHSLSCSRVVEGLIQFRRDYRGEIRLEVFIVPGLNDTEEELNSLKAAITKISPDCVQLNSLDRPGTETWVKAPADNDLVRIAAYLGYAEIINVNRSRKRKNTGSYNENVKQVILSTLSRRPCTSEDLAGILDLRPAEVNKFIRLLLDEGMIECEQQQRGQFLKLKRQ